MDNQKILVTGATGFVGSRLVNTMLKQNLRLVAYGRTQPEGSCEFISGELSGNADYSSAVQGCSVVVHVAARAHVMGESPDHALERYRDTNIEATLKLAKDAAKAGVERFIFISSIKVNGESTKPGESFAHDDKPNPQDPYGFSKAEAEDGLRKLCAESGMDLVIIRPPLVYGPGVKANFSALLKLAKKNLPLPLGAINNSRSFVALDNLIDLILVCIENPAASNQTFLVSDDHDISTTELLELMTLAFHKKPRLLPVPVGLLRFVGRLTGKEAALDRLCSNLQVDIAHTKETLGWTPPISVEEGVKSSVIV